MCEATECNEINRDREESEIGLASDCGRCDDDCDEMRSPRRQVRSFQ